MFDLGWMELLVIGVVALIVVGPKDLPGMFRTVGQFMGKMRAMAREFQRTMEAAADDTGLKEATKGLQTMSNPMQAAKSSVKDFASSITDDEDPEAAAEAAAKAARGKAALEKAQAEAATKAAESAAAKEP